MKRVHIIIIGAALLISAATGGWMASQRADDDLFELKKNFEIFGALYQEIVINYVDDVRPGPFMTAGVDAMMSRLDPYSIYYDQAVNVDMDLLRRGPLGDVGINIGMRNGQITVLSPEAETSAYIQGVKTGDVIRSVSGVDTAEMTVQDVVGLLRGDSGSTVTITVERQGEPRILKFTLQRTISRTENILYSGYLDDDPKAGIGYVRLSVFGSRSAREIRRALRAMERSDGLKAIILDLRDNPGGILNEAIETVALFVPKGTLVVSTRGRIDGITQNYATQEDPFFENIPVVVLVNGISASASEIVAAALQDLDRGVILGETTFGKGLVQVMRQLPHNTSMKLTIGHYYTPSGRDIQSKKISSDVVQISTPEIDTYRTASGREVRSGVGIEPDIRVSLEKEGELEGAIKRSGAFFQFAGDYATSRGDIPSDSLFLDDDEIFSEFQTWLGETGFRYESRAEVLLDSLKSRLTGSGYQNAIEQLETVRGLTIEGKRQDLNRYRDRIITQLRKGIFARYLTEAQQIRRALDRDPVVARARELARSPDSIKSILGS
ncbi:MAG: S41 family peptidase [Bacteroidetes bacterium]|nr:MAG: S41 family peptidase [Bacteroidota bacterium]